MVIPEPKVKSLLRQEFEKFFIRDGYQLGQKHNLLSGMYFMRGNIRISWQYSPLNPEIVLLEKRDDQGAPIEECCIEVDFVEGVEDEKDTPIFLWCGDNHPQAEAPTFEKALKAAEDFLNSRL